MAGHVTRKRSLIGMVGCMGVPVDGPRTLITCVRDVFGSLCWRRDHDLHACDAILLPSEHAEGHRKTDPFIAEPIAANCDGLLELGHAQSQPLSMARLFVPRTMRNHPSSPKYVPHELLPIQYLTPPSPPYPATSMMWSTSMNPMVSLKMPPL